MDVNIPALSGLGDAAKDFIQKVITPPLEEVGLLFADKVKLWRFKNQIKIVSKAEEYLNAKNLKTKKVSLKILAPLLEGAAMEEEETIQNKWSALLANTVMEGSDIDESTIYSYILTQLTKRDAELFEYIYGRSNPRMQENNRFSSTQIIVATEKMVDEAESLLQANVSLDNLFRLRLIKEGEGRSMGYKSILVTHLGYVFMSAVTKK